MNRRILITGAAATGAIVLIPPLSMATATRINYVYPRNELTRLWRRVRHCANSIETKACIDQWYGTHPIFRDANAEVIIVGIMFPPDGMPKKFAFSPPFAVNPYIDARITWRADGGWTQDTKPRPNRRYVISEYVL